MPLVHLRKARVEEPIVAQSTFGESELLQPGEYFVEEAGLTMRLHATAQDEQAVAEVAVSAFDSWLSRHQVVFLSWN